MSPSDTQAAPAETKGGTGVWGFLCQIIQFFDHHLQELPRWLQNTVCIVLLLAYAVLVAAAGTVVVEGTVFEPAPGGGHAPARFYDVRLDGHGRPVGTNSQGDYYLAMSRPKWLLLVAKGKMQVAVSDSKGNFVNDYTVLLDRVPPAARRLNLDDRSAVVSRHVGGRLVDWIVAPLDAMGPGRGKLFVRTVRLGPQLSRTRRVTMSCACGLPASGLLASRMRGRPIDSIPVAAGDATSYQNDYYFEIAIPPGAGGQLKITLKDADAFLPSTEVFLLRDTLTLVPGQDVTVRGDRGTTLTLTLVVEGR